MKIIYNQNGNYIELNGFTLLILAAFFNDSVLIYVKAVLGNLFGYNNFVNMFIPGLFVVLLLFSMKQMAGYIRVQHMLFVLLCLLIVGASYIIYPQNREFYNEYNMELLFTQAVPFFFLGICVCFDKRLLKQMARLSWFAIIVNILYVYFFIQTREMDNDSMGWAYTALFPTMISICAMFESDKKKDTMLGLLFSVFGVLYIIAMGTRGPILIVFLYLLIMLLRKSQGKVGMKIFLFFITAILALVFSSGVYIELLENWSRMLAQNGLSSRTLDIFLEGEFITHTSGRDIIYESLLGRLNERPILGYGIFGEWQFIDYSAHNIWIQLCMHFGYLAGSLILLTHIVITIKALQKSKNSIAIDMIILFSCFAYGRGIFGGDYLNYEFVFLLGLSLHEIRVSKNTALYSKQAKGCLRKAQYRDGN